MTSEGLFFVNNLDIWNIQLLGRTECIAHEIYHYIQDMGIASYRARQLMKGIYVQKLPDFSGITTFSKSLRDSLNKKATLRTFKAIKTIKSDYDGTTKFLWSLKDGLKIYNISDSANPTMLGSLYDSYTFSHELFFDGEFVYIADYDDDLEIVDVGDPTVSELIGQCNDKTSGGRWTGSTSVSVVGHLVLLASQDEGLEIIDVNIPTNPSEIGKFCCR